MIELSPEQTHYIINVMRAQENAPFRFFNGQDGEWIARLTTKPKKKKPAILEIETQRRQQSTCPDLWLCAAPIKKTHFAFMIMKATELGVSTIQPVVTERTQVRDCKISRLTSIAIEAAEQSERLTIPEIKEPLALPDLLDKWPEDRFALLCAEFGEAQDVGKAFTGIETPAAIFTGPEGGYTKEELELFTPLNKKRSIRLGPRILRADTAAIAALSCWQSVCGDWRQSE